MPEGTAGTAVLDRPQITVPPPDVTPLNLPLELPPRDIATEPTLPPQMEDIVPPVSDFVSESNQLPNVTPQDNEELRRLVLENMGIGSHSSDENHSPLMSTEELHSFKKKGVLSKISEFFNGGSVLSKIAKISFLPIAFLLFILSKGIKGSNK